MKGAVVLLEKDGVLVRTAFDSPNVVKWFDSTLYPLHELSEQGYTRFTIDLVAEAISRLHTLRDRLCAGGKVTNGDLLDVIRMLEEY